MIGDELIHWQFLTILAVIGLISAIIFAVYMIKREMKKFTREIVYGKSAELVSLDVDELTEFVYVFKYIRANEKDAVERYVRNLK